MVDLEVDLSLECAVFASLDAADPQGSSGGLRSVWPRAVSLLLWALLVALPACGHELLEEWPTPDDKESAPSPRATTPASRARAPLGSFAVVGGMAADDGAYPATGVLLYALRQSSVGRPRPMGTMLCTASLVAPDVVVAAAHCREPRLAEAETYFSLLADVSLSGPSALRLPDDAVRVTHFSPHPLYARSARTRRVGRVNDVALFYLERALDAEPVRLPTPAIARGLLGIGRRVDIVGYGRRSEWFYGGGDDGQKTWGPSTLSDVGDYELEIGRVEGDAFKCFGDSGGPTFAVDADGEPWMIGVTARGAALSMPDTPFGQGNTACRTGGIDTRIDPYRAWIDSDMRLLCAGPERPACDPRQPGLPASP